MMISKRVRFLACLLILLSMSAACRPGESRDPTAGTAEVIQTDKPPFETDKETENTPFHLLPAGKYALFLSDLPLYDSADRYQTSPSDLNDVLIFSLPSVFKKTSALSFSAEGEEAAPAAEITALALYRVDASYRLDENALYFVDPILGVEDDGRFVISREGTTETGFDFILFLLDEEDRMIRQEELHESFYQYGRWCFRIDGSHVLTFEILSKSETCFKEVIEGLNQIERYTK